MGESPLISSRRVVLSPRSARRSEPLPPPLTGAASAGATSNATREARPARRGCATHAACVEPARCAARSRRVCALCCLAASFRCFVHPPCPSPCCERPALARSTCHTHTTRPRAVTSPPAAPPRRIAPSKHRRSSVMSVCYFVAPRGLVLLFNSVFRAPAHATWQKARSRPSGGEK